MKKGDKYSEIVVFTQQQVINFAEVTGDTNPIHIDDDFALKSRFGQKIIHGFLSGSVFSKIIGTKFPGFGSIYLSQSMKFLKPMFVDTEYNIQIEVIGEIPEKERYILRTQILKDGNIQLDGEAIVYYPKSK